MPLDLQVGPPHLRNAPTLIGEDRMLGFTAFGAEASELMAVVQARWHAVHRAPRPDMGRPIVAEGLHGLCANPPAAPWWDCQNRTS